MMITPVPGYSCLIFFKTSRPSVSSSLKSHKTSVKWLLLSSSVAAAPVDCRQHFKAIAGQKPRQQICSVYFIINNQQLFHNQHRFKTSIKMIFTSLR